MLQRFEMSDGLGAIYPSMMNSIIALRCLGYSVDDPQFIRALDEFEKLGIEEGDTFRMQPCMSPVWDTAYALFALGEAGVPANDPRMIKCADWIIDMGPEGGEGGGRVIAAGTPEEIVKTPSSYTGQYLRSKLLAHPREQQKIA